MNIESNITIVRFKFPKITISAEVKELIKDWGVKITVTVCLVAALWYIQSLVTPMTCAC